MANISYAKTEFSDVENVVIVGTVDDVTATEVSYNGQTYPVVDQVFTIDFGMPLEKNPSYDLTVTIVDGDSADQVIVGTFSVVDTTPSLLEETTIPEISDDDVLVKDFENTGEIPAADFADDQIVNDYVDPIETDTDSVKNTSVAGAEIVYGPIENDDSKWPHRRNIKASVVQGYFTPNLTDAEDENSTRPGLVKRGTQSAGFDTSGFTF